MPSWEHLKELFEGLADLTPDQRAAHLDKLCGAEPSLRAELEKLLEADEKARSFMQVPAIHWSSSTVTTSPAVFSAGEQVAGRFRIVRFLGQGGMGQVYQAEDEVLGGFVALKAIRPEIASDEQTLERFKQEVRLAKEVTDENVCRVFDLDHHNVPPFITMELVEGETLSRRLHKGRMTTAEALPLIEQMAQGLNAAHRKGIIHRDLKPGNIMLTGTGHGAVRVKVMDFGLARSLEGNTSLAGRKVGTPDYMAPELLAGGRATVASDIYALGLVMFEMVTGTKPAFDRSREPARSPCALIPGLDPSWETAILGCLERDPARRISSTIEVADVIRGKTSLWRWVRGHRRVMWAAGLALLSLFLIRYVIMLGSRPFGEPTLSQVTTDPGLSSYPAVSPDGKWLAYASDRSGDGDLDIWLRQIDGGEPMRLTRNPADDYDPSFSMDGTKIAFRSERDGGGIYLVSTLGGDPQLLAPGGYGPRFSPDGQWIAYWVGSPGSGFVPGSHVYVKPTRGGPARQVQTNLMAEFWPVWSPDSKRLLVIGRPDAKQDPSVNVDWWVVPLNGGVAVKAFALSSFRRQKLVPQVGQDWISPIVWLPGENRVLFSAKLGDTSNLWDVSISGTGKVIGIAARRTFTTSVDLHASVILEPNGSLRRMLFSSLAGAVGIWSLPIDANTARVTGEMVNLTRGIFYAAAPSISADGTSLVFISTRSKIWSLRTRDLETGKEDMLASADANWFRAQISPDGGSIAYVDPGDHMYVVNTHTGTTEKICDRCGPPTDVGPGGQKILFEPIDPPEDVMTIDAPTGRIGSFVHAGKPDHILYGGRYSPDGRWVAFHATVDKSPNFKVFISPVRDGHGLAEADWISVTDGSQIDRNVAWSPDGNLLYFLSQRDGFRCVWAQPLDPATKQPAGTASAVRHFHNPRQSLARVDRPSLIGMSVARGRLIFAMSELTGNIWMEERKTAPGRE